MSVQATIIVQCETGTTRDDIAELCEMLTCGACGTFVRDADIDDVETFEDE